jgi:hypothetical protein
VPLNGFGVFSCALVFFSRSGYSAALCKLVMQSWSDEKDATVRHAERIVVKFELLAL